MLLYLLYLGLSPLFPEQEKAGIFWVLTIFTSGLLVSKLGHVRRIRFLKNKDSAPKTTGYFKKCDQSLVFK